MLGRMRRWLGLLLVIACDKTSPSGLTADAAWTADATVGPDALTAQLACADEANARCALQASCSTDGIQRIYGDLATCVVRVTASCEAALAAPGTGATPALAEACAQALPAVPCLNFETEALPTACLPPAGALAAGSPCAFSGQCQSSFCNASGTSACGVCAAKTVAGDSCATTGCSVGLFCDPSTTQCQPLGIAGTSCDAGHLCAPALYCDLTSNKCAASAAASATCDPARTTAPWCDTTQELYCDSGTSMCTAANPGTTCSTFANGAEALATEPVHCSAGAACIPTGTNPGPGTCVLPAADGAACDPAAGPPCLEPAKCDQGTCVVPGTQTCL
jgi:hypothetical protein